MREEILALFGDVEAESIGRDAVGVPQILPRSRTPIRCWPEGSKR